MKTKRTYTINATPEAMAIFDERAKRHGRSRSGQFEFEARNNDGTIKASDLKVIIERASKTKRG